MGPVADPEAYVKNPRSSKIRECQGQVENKYLDKEIFMEKNGVI